MPYHRPAKSSTIRPLILPAFISSKICGASSTWRSCTTGTTSPSAPELEGFGKILAGANQRAEHANTVKNDLCNRQFHLLGRKAHSHHATPGTHALNRLVKSNPRYCGHHGGLRPAVGYLTNLRRYILNFATVNRDIGTGFGGKLKLVIVNIDGNNLGTENLLGVLYRQVTQPARTVGDQPLTGRICDSLIAL